MKIPENFIFFAYDGDSVGSRVGRATMANDLDELTKISNLIHAGHELVRRWVKDHDGIWINGGGDEGLAAIPKYKEDELEHLRKDYEYLVGHTISIGVGKEPSESGRALLIAKLKGKNQIVTFGEATEKEIRRIKKRAKKGAFKSMEEHKLAEAYLKKSEESKSPIGTTGSGKAIHAHANHPEHTSFNAQDHKDAGNMHRDLAHGILHSVAKEKGKTSYDKAIIGGHPKEPSYNHHKTQQAEHAKLGFAASQPKKRGPSMAAANSVARAQMHVANGSHFKKSENKIPTSQNETNEIVEKTENEHVVPDAVGKLSDGTAFHVHANHPENAHLKPEHHQQLAIHHSSLANSHAKAAKTGQNYGHSISWSKQKSHRQQRDFHLAQAKIHSDKVSGLNKSEEIQEQNCPYCEQTDGVDLDHCKWCHDAEPAAGEENCPYCIGMQNDPAEGPKEPEIADEDCAYCNEKEQEEQDSCPYCNDTNEANESILLAPRIGTGPDSTNEQAPAGSPEEKELYAQMDMAPPEIGKPLPPDKRPPIGQNAPMDVVPKDPEMEEPALVNGAMASKTIDPEDTSSKEALSAIASAIENDEHPTTQEVNAIDDTELPVSNEAEGNISRPSGFAQNTPQDMGEEGPNPPVGPGSDGEGDPDFYEVLENGLDDHADSIQREKTVQVVSQALVQFKACKGTLENIKMQAPDLYAASISMLKAMIEMASMLGLGASNAAPGQELGAEQTSLTPEAETKPPEEQNDEWHDPFPTHPDSGGEPKPQHAPSEKNPKGSAGAIGQPIGKLSAKHTTEHVARVPTPPGAINEKGQQKVIDPKTGKTRWIDRKQGMVQSATGVPIKPPSRGQNV